MIESDGSLGEIVRTISPARMALSLGLDVNRSADPFSQAMTMIANINKEYMVDPAADIVISERTPIDSLAYTFYQLREVWKHLDVDFAEWYWNQLLILGTGSMDIYDHIFYFPAYFAPVGDGVRDNDREYQLDIDLLIKKLLDENDLEVHIVPDVDSEHRLEWFKEIMQDADL
jgi:hypothetical protein